MVWVWRARGTTLYSSPTAIRTNDTYLQAHGQMTNLPVFDEEAFESVSVERVGGDLTVRYAKAEDQRGDALFGAVTSHKAESAETIQIGEGSIRLEYVGVVTERPGATNNNLIVPAKYFTADLKSAAEDDPILKLEPYRQGLDGSRLPMARFIFACSNLTDLVTWQFHAFDARTHYPLCTWNYHQAPFLDTISFGTPLKVWHQTHIELAVTLTTGPTKRYSMAAAEGTVLKLPIGGIKLLAIEEGRLESKEVSGPPTPNTVTLTKTQGRPDDSPEVSLVFYCWPRMGTVPWELECYDDAGSQMPIKFNAGSGTVAVRSVTGSREKLKEIRVKHYPNLHRLSVTIPELPGLPGENRNLQNLFDVRVPYINQSQYPQSIGDLVQMRVNLYVSHYPFGTECTNTTARAVFEELTGVFSEDYDFVVDNKKNEIRFREHFLAGPINFVKGVFRIR